MNPSRSLLVHGSVVCCLLALVGCDLMKKEQSPPPPQQPPPVVTPAPKPAEKAPATTTPTKAANPAPTTPPTKAADPAPTTTPPPKVAQPAPIPVTTPPSKVDAAKKAALPPELLQAQGEIAQAKGHIDMTIAKLEVLAGSTGDLDKPSEDAAAAIEALGKATEALKSRADEMRQRGATYFEAWEKQLASTSTPAIAQLISKRKEDLAQKYADVLTSMQQARASYDPLWAGLQDTSKAIDDGLNPDKVKLFQPTLAKLKTQATTFKDRLDNVWSKVDQIAVIYTSP